MEHDKAIAGNGAAAAAKHARTDTKPEDALKQLRAAAQELHGSISDAAARHGGAMKTDLAAIPEQAMAIIESAKASMAGQNEATREHLNEAVTHLQTLRMHVAKGLKSTGHPFQISVRRGVSDARASAQKVSEALAEQRRAAAATKSK